MFDHCLHAMSAEPSDVVMDLMERGPSENAYTDLKATYIEPRTPTSTSILRFVMEQIATEAFSMVFVLLRLPL